MNEAQIPTQMELISEEMTPLSVIRTETVLSKMPIHNLSKKGKVSIEIKRRNAKGAVELLWEVSYNDKYGQPRQLAYKLDTVIVNRRIEESGRPVPKLVKLGSLSQICRELGIESSGKNTNSIRRALHQNAGAYITAKLNYKGADGTERTIEAGDTRYGVVFTGERLPDGRRADAVYLRLHDFYLEVLNNASTRPLNYDYLKGLLPAPQRFYEVISYRIFAALKNKHPHAKITYSEYCTFSAQKRHLDHENFRVQMYNVHKPHLQSGYLAKVATEQATDADGNPDWVLYYTPGYKAKQEYTTFTRKRHVIDTTLVTRPASDEEKQVTPSEPEPSSTKQREPQLPARKVEADKSPLEQDPLVSQLVSFRITESTAKELVRDYRKAVELQLEALPHRNLTKIRDLASWLVVAIKENHELPQSIVEAQARTEETKKAKDQKQLVEAHQRDEETRKAAYLDFLKAKAKQVEKKQPERYQAFLEDSATKRATLELDSAHKGQVKKIYLRLFDDEQSHLERFREFFNESIFEQWQQTTSSE